MSLPLGLAPLVGECQGCGTLLFEDDPYVEYGGAIYYCEDCEEGE
jgi:hypothetical protein